ncbi:MAG TPA: AI-2E family transporter [Longimicrobiales bacterium]|nr:AI-2E family transporter [Longimicrobiales bacterium]
MQPTQTPIELRYVYGALVLAAAAIFLLGIHSALSPIIAYVLVLMLMAPYIGTDRHTTVVIAVTFAFAIWLLDAMGSLLAPFILAFVLAYILDPAVDVLERRGVSRTLAVALLMLPVLLLLGAAIGFGIPALINQVQALFERLPAAAARAVEWITETRQSAQRWNLPFISDATIARWLDPQRIAAYVETQQEAITQGAWGTVTGVGRGFGIVLSVLGFLVLTPVLMIYLLKDFDNIKLRVADLMPHARREAWLDFATEYDSLLSRFLRGQLIAAALVGVLTWLGLWIAGVPYSGLVGAIAGVFNLVPYLGLIVSVVPVLIIALLSGSFLSIIIRAGIVFAIIQTIDSTIAGPRIVGGSVGLHPVWVILALAVGGAFFGFVGLLIAMPAAVLIKLLLRHGLERYRRSAVFLGTPSPPA